MLKRLFSILFDAWFLLALGAIVCCAWLGAVFMRAVPRLDLGSVPDRLALAGAVVFGAACALYTVFASRRLRKRDVLLDRQRHELDILRKRNRHLEVIQSRQTRRLDELVTLREMATIVNHETDFTVIAEKTLELVSGLLEPMEVTMFLENPKKERLEPFAQYADGTCLLQKKALTRSIPNFRPSQFESHSIICRVHGMELHAIVPLKVEEKCHGVLFLVFTTDGRPAGVQTGEFNEKFRHVLLEVAHHISLAVKTKYFHTKAVVANLTGLYTRSHFDAQVQSAIELARRSGDPFCLVLADIDHFKKVNDTYGHATGDVVLERVAQRIQRVLRKYDTAYRYGGEELAVLLPNTHLAEGVQIAERLREKIESQKIRGAQNRLVPVTISSGVAELKSDEDPESLFQRADELLYEAKENGRNQVRPKLSESRAA